MLREGLVSTIIPVHNRAALLRDAVTSVLAQTWSKAGGLLEIIIVDDGSTDDTPSSIAALAAAYPNEVIGLRIVNAGPGAAREAGRQVANGEFIQYLDSDDILLPRKFELQISGLRANPQCGVAYGKTRFQAIGDPPSDVAWKRTGERIDTMFPSMLQSRWWGTSTPLYRRQETDDAGPWLIMKAEEDWEYDCRIASRGVALAFCNEFVSQEHDHGGSRLSRGGSSETPKLKDRAKAHGSIFDHARGAGVDLELPEVRHYARECFLLSRQCGAAGLASEARMLFDLARVASGPRRGRGADFLTYRTFATLIGWERAGWLACQLDGFRR